MEANANTIKTMGIISNEVYNKNKAIIDYFKDDYDIDGNKIIKFIEGTTYKVLDHTGDSTLTGFNALLLQEEGTKNYVIAFRGTDSILDGLVDLAIGGHFNPQYNDAVAFVNKALSNPDINKNNLTLTGHSLGAILTQQVGATLSIPGYAFNPYGTNALIRYPNLGNILLDILAAVGAGSAIEYAKNNIVNISYQDDGALNGDPLSNFATNLTSEHLGDFIPVWGPNIGLSGHFMKPLNDAINTYNTLLQGIDYKKLSEAFFANAISPYDDFNRTKNTLQNLITGNANATIEIMTNHSISQIKSLAETNTAYAYALDNMNGFVVHNTSYANTTDYTKVSDIFLQKRAEALYYAMNPDAYENNSDSAYIVNAPDVGIRLGHTSFGFPSDKHKVIFGGDLPNTKFLLGGDSGDDFIFGMGGNDELVGNAGNDYLEGGTGDDSLHGSDDKNKIITCNLYVSPKNKKVA